MTETEALHRLRALRAASYRCQARPHGAQCGRPAKHVAPLTDEGLALCSFHMTSPHEQRAPRLA